MLCDKEFMYRVFKIKYREFGEALKFAIDFHKAIVRYKEYFARHGGPNKDLQIVFSGFEAVDPESKDTYIVNPITVKRSDLSALYEAAFQRMVSNLAFAFKARGAKQPTTGVTRPPPAAGPVTLPVGNDRQLVDGPLARWLRSEVFPGLVGANNAPIPNLRQYMTQVFQRDPLVFNGQFTTRAAEILLLIAAKLRNKQNGDYNNLEAKEASARRKYPTDAMIAAFIDQNAPPASFVARIDNGKKTWVPNDDPNRKLSNVLAEISQAKRPKPKEFYDPNKLSSVHNFKSIVTASIRHMTPEESQMYFAETRDQIDQEFQFIEALYYTNFPQAIRTGRTGAATARRSTTCIKADKPPKATLNDWNLRQ